jgi:NADPH2:quinone reductase
MRAIRVHQFGPAENLKLEEIEEPTPGFGEVRVRISSIGVNPVDTYLRSGSNPTLKLPYTPGFDAAGTVEAIGAGITSLNLGQRVYLAGSLSGTYAEAALCKSSQVFPLPDSIDFDQGAALGIPYATAFRALFQRGSTVAGEKVFIHGASGGVGIASLQWCRMHGLHAVGTSSTPEGRNLILSLGAEAALDHASPNYLQKARDLTLARGYDLVLEMLANVNLGNDLSLLAPRGRVVVVGSRGKVEVNPRDLMTREADVRGVMLFNTPESDLISIHEAIQAGLRSGSLKPLIGERLPLAEAVAAHQKVLQSGSFGKIVLRP